MQVHTGHHEYAGVVLAHVHQTKKSPWAGMARCALWQPVKCWSIIPCTSCSASLKQPEKPPLLLTIYKKDRTPRHSRSCAVHGGPCAASWTHACQHCSNVLHSCPVPGACRTAPPWLQTLGLLRFAAANAASLFACLHQLCCTTSCSSSWRTEGETGKSRSTSKPAGREMSGRIGERT